MEISAILAHLAEKKILPSANWKFTTLDAAFESFTLPLSDRQRLYKEVQIGLYQRSAICIKHHPADLPAYLQAWRYRERIFDSEPRSINKSEKDISPATPDKLSVKESGK